MKTLTGSLITCFLMIAGLSSAQDDISSREAKGRLVPGIKVGLNRSNVYDEQGADFVADPKTGFMAGAWLSIPVGRLLGVQPELLFSQKGFSSSGRINGDRYTLERTTNWLDIPLQVQLKPFRFMTLLGGIQYSYLFSQQDRLSLGSTILEYNDEFENDNIRKNIFGAVAGLDLNFHHVVLSGKACWDLRANRGDGSSFTPRYKNVWFQIGVGYRFY